MGLVKKLKKGIVGIEAAIVMIAFVVVAAALAFVVLNMGFYTTQRSKEVMAAGLAQASSSLEIDGSVLAEVKNITITDKDVNFTGFKLTCIVIPIRLSAGQKEVDLTPNKTTIAIWVKDKIAITNAYINKSQAIPIWSGNYSIDTLCRNASKLDDGHYSGVIVVWGPGSNGDTVLGPGEKALVVINFSTPLFGKIYGLDPYDVVKVEIKPPIGAALTVERTVPASLNYKIFDLG